jgi:hypothetical protein
MHMSCLKRVVTTVLGSRWKLPAVLAVVALALPGAPATAQSSETFYRDPATGRVVVQFPPNRLAKPRFEPGPDDAEQRRIFAALIDAVAKPYVELVERNEIYMQDKVERPGKLFRVKLVVDEASKDWENEKINAMATQGVVNGTGLWTIKMFGGLFRRPEITKDGFTLVVCHEIGHHFAGFPFRVAHWGGYAEGLAAEGQGDFFGTHSCLRRLWRGQDNSPPYDGPDGRKIELSEIPKRVRDACRAQWNDQADVALCHRIAMAGFSVGTLWGALDKDGELCETPTFPQPCYPSFDRTDRTQTSNTDGEHPRAQCRLDTYFAGAVCRVEFGPSPGGKVIPGTFGHIPENSARARAEAFSRSCAPGRPGARPLCWFSPADVSP